MPVMRIDRAAFAVAVMNIRTQIVLFRLVSADHFGEYIVSTAAHGHRDQALGCKPQWSCHQRI